MDLSNNALPTSWYIGEGWEDIKNAVAGAWNNIVTTAGNLWNSWSNWIQNKLKQVNIFGVNLGEWFDDDPIGATAGTGAALLGAGVVLLSGPGKILGKVVGGIKTLWRAAKSLPGLVGLGGLVRFGVGFTQRTWNFNWNISDKQIRQQQQAQLNSLGGVWGEALGSMVGTLCGYSLGRIAYANQAKLVRMNPDLIAKLDALRIDNFDEDSELWEESIENLKAATRSTIRTAINVGGLEAFLNIRKMIKAVSRGVNLGAIAPGLAEKAEKWGEEGQKPWSFALAQEEFIESLPDGFVQNFAEEFIEAAQDMCAESTILVSYAL